MMKVLPKGFGLRAKVILAAFFLQVAIISLVTYSTLQGQLSKVEESMENIYRNVAMMAGETCKRAIETRNESFLRNKIEKARMDENILYVIIQDREGIVLASSDPSLRGKKLSDTISRTANESRKPIFQEIERSDSFLDRWVFAPGMRRYDEAVPLFQGGEKLGLIRVGLTAKKMAPGIVRSVRWLLVMIFSVFAAGTGIAVWVDLKLRGNVARLIDVTAEMARGDLTRRVRITTADEFEHLGNSFNIMAEKLELREAENLAMRDEIRAYAVGLEEKVTERTQELFAEKQKLDAIVSAVGVGLTLLDENRNVLWVNKTMKEWFGPLGSISGKKCHEVVWRSHAMCSDCPSERTLIDGKIQHAEKTVTTEGETKFFQITSSPVRNAEGEVSQVVELIQDVTGKKKIEAQLVQTAKMAAIGQLAAGVAHEINNPTGIISAKARLLLDRYRDQVPSKVVTDTGKIIKHADRIAAITRGLLTFSRQLGGERTSVNINSVIEEALALVEFRLSGRHLRIEKELLVDPPSTRGNPGELQQVVVNLLGNAIDAMPEGGTLSIRTEFLSTDLEDDGQHQWVILKITDTGTGIPKEAQKHLFDPFFSTKEVGQGTGLGLSISHGIVKNHGGKIVVESEPGKFTTFSVLLPCRANGTIQASRSDRLVPSA